MARARFDGFRMHFDTVTREEASQLVTSAMKLGALQAVVDRGRYRDTPDVEVVWPAMDEGNGATGLVAILKFMAEAHGVTFEELLDQPAGV